MKRLLNLTRALVHRLLVLIGAVGLTFALFLVLPVIQSIGNAPDNEMLIRTVDAVAPPPPPPIEEPPPEEEEPEEEPELEPQQAEPLDLSELELALNPGMGAGLPAGALKIDLGTATSSGGIDELFSMAELDQRPRPTYQPGPTVTTKLREHTPGTVYVIFIVNQDGRVENARVQKSSHPALDKTALDAVAKWRFEPGKRNGEPVRFRMRVPMTFPKM